MVDDMSEWKYKLDDEIRNADTLLDDSDLKAIIVAGTYHFEFQIFYSTNTTADFKAKVQYAGTSTNYYMTEFSTPHSSNGGVWNRAHVKTGSWQQWGVTTTETATHGYVRFSGVLVSSTGSTLVFQWGQQTTDAGDTIVLSGSRMRITRIK